MASWGNLSYSENGEEKLKLSSSSREEEVGCILVLAEGTDGLSVENKAEGAQLPALRKTDEGDFLGDFYILGKEPFYFRVLARAIQCEAYAFGSGTLLLCHL